MKTILKVFLILIVLIVLVIIWYWADHKDYFCSRYKDLTEQQTAIFKWQAGDDEFKLKARFREHFNDIDLVFPREKVSKVKLFKNIPMLGVFTGKTLKQNQIDNFVKFCNDTTNFDWGETTWNITEGEYYFKLYNSTNNVVGKIYFCLEGCSMTSSRPFCPSMKFGKLSLTGLEIIKKLINDNDNWE
jgi:hypothetical protein